jgi:hypothetical protein
VVDRSPLLSFGQTIPASTVRSFGISEIWSDLSRSQKFMQTIFFGKMDLYCFNLKSQVPMIFKIVPLAESTKLDGNGFTGSDGWLPGDYGALESVYTLGSNWSPDGAFQIY